MKKSLPICSLFFLTVLFMSSCGSSDKKDIDLSKVKMVFDIPSLIGYDIDQVRTVYAMSATEEGAEPTEEQMKLKPISWEDLFERGDDLLLITYNPVNRKVLEYFIATRDPLGVTKDYSDLMKICNIRNGDSSYSIVPVRSSNDPQIYTGIRIVVK